MKKQRNSKQRRIILDAVTARCDHPTADQIYLDVRAIDGKISRGTVYRNLGILSENEEITNVKVPAADRMTPAVTATIIFSARDAAGFLTLPCPTTQSMTGRSKKRQGFRFTGTA